MRSVRRRDKRGWFLLLGVFVMVFLFTFLSRSSEVLEEKVEAASLAGFDPGYIISDYQMSNYGSMSEAEIQAFLSAKGNCRDTRIYLADYYPNLYYHIKDGHFVCLAEETFGEGTAYGDSAPSGETAAHIIWKAAQDYRINPQVLLVLIQKEQGLVTDSWPNNVQYRSATGYGCPDTAPCASEYYGFRNQVRKAAGMFRTVLDGGWTNYPLGQNYIQYNPTAECGGSIVNIRSLATSALYRYTPYQPNAGALAAGYGTAECGSYGNRNFYLYFEDWFSGITLSVDPRSEIEKYYDFLGGKGSYLGDSVGGEVCSLVKNGCYKAFQNGYIYWTKNSGVHDIKRGLIYDAWFSQGTEWGPFGYPIESEKIDGNIIRQEFENGTILVINNETYLVRNFVGKKWSVDGLGNNLDFGVCGLVRDGCYQTFENGYVYYSQESGAHMIYGAFYERYSQKKKENGVLGYPVNEVEILRRGLRQKFENGYIYWNELIGAWDVSGGILLKWREIGSEDGPLGYPTSSEQKNDAGLIYQTFEHGTIYWDVQTGAWVVRDFATEKWESLGGVKSKLGKTITNGYCGLVNGGCYQAFMTGNIYWTETTGGWDVSGGIYQAYLKNGTEWGPLGYPTSSEQKNDAGLIYQTFEHGTIYWDVQTGAWVVRDFATEKWESLGGVKSKLGKTITNGYCGLVNGGCYQAFMTGNIYWTETTGGWDVSGGIYQAYLKNGTEWGPLGYPTSSEQKNDAGLIYQTFEHGTIYWDVQTGAWVELAG